MGHVIVVLIPIVLLAPGTALMIYTFLSQKLSFGWRVLTFVLASVMLIPGLWVLWAYASLSGGRTG